MVGAWRAARSSVHVCFDLSRFAAPGRWDSTWGLRMLPLDTTLGHAVMALTGVGVGSIAVRMHL